MLKSEQLRRLRLHRMAEVLVAMYNAGVGVFSWQKHAVFNPTPPDDIRIEWPMYYSSREVKEIGPQRDKIRGSRATGVLLTENNVFSVYNAGGSEIKWAREAELRLLCEPDRKAAIDNILLEGLSEAQRYGRVESDAVDGECLVLFGYTCDMPRIRRFNVWTLWRLRPFCDVIDRPSHIFT